MRKSIKILAAPLWGGITLLALATPFCVLITLKGGEVSNGTAHLYNAAFGFLVAWSVELDRKALGVSAPFEYSAFMFFFWWILLPFYLFKTRQWRGLTTALGVFFVSSLPSIVALSVNMLIGNTP